MKYNKRNNRRRTRRRTRRRRKGGDFPGPETKKRWEEGANTLYHLGEKTGDMANMITDTTIQVGKEANEERKKNKAINEQKYTIKEEGAEQTAGKRR